MKSSPFLAVATITESASVTLGLFLRLTSSLGVTVSLQSVNFVLNPVVGFSVALGVRSVVK